MHFEYPAFLFALFALLIPIIIHLFNFRRYKKLYFSNVQFLKQVEEQQASGRNIKERLILLNRLLALLFLILAFAKPYLSKQGNAALNSRQTVSIFIDNSNSMQALGSEGSLLDEAKSRAKQIAAGYDLNTRFQLLTQDFFGKDQRFIDRAEFDNEVDGVALSSQSRNIADIITRQQSLLLGKGTSYIVSDFQLGMNDGKTSKLSNALNLIQLKANSLPNLAIDSVWLQRAVHRPGEIEKLVFKLHNYADEKAVQVLLKLYINGQQKGLGSYNVAAGAVVTDTISFSGLQSGWQRAELRLQDNPVIFDNNFYFGFNVSAQMPVLLIGDNTPNFYIKSAFGSEPFFNITATPFGGINYSSLQNYPLIVISDVRELSAGLSQQLKAYVQKGGNLAIFPSKDADITSYKNFLESINGGYLEKKVNDTLKVSRLNLSAALYKNTFENVPQNPDLPKVTAYYPLTNGASSEQLMTLQNNRAFWQTSKYKSGRVYICAVPVDEAFSNLPRHSLFITTLLRIALSSGSEQALYSTIGQTKPIALNNLTTNADDVLRLVNGKQQIIPDLRNIDGATTLYVSDQITRPGIYNLSKKDSLVAVLSFNSNRRESNLHYYSSAALKEIAGKAGKVIEADRSAVKSQTGNAGLGFQLWKLCLILTLIFLAIEILLIRFYKVPKTATA
ncbi:BatA domain-containing protein [Mucilaginibacter ginkgonis]|uniref:BatA domain-containing protein n=1 Tax=Mucilaginibacter ginkgonis TaxID=2682091 RepID=A0A6I4IN28_9SPHI|nr:BatA domain-containing protein [Mucilaginibacter ginkgonis]QQL51055.1 BatA domain-containing protein [Mucilaginibacter ginkgonis]